jgi:hypothetical protein
VKGWREVKVRRWGLQIDGWSQVSAEISLSSSPRIDSFLAEVTHNNGCRSRYSQLEKADPIAIQSPVVRAMLVYRPAPFGTCTRQRRTACVSSSQLDQGGEDHGSRCMTDLLILRLLDRSRFLDTCNSAYLTLYTDIMLKETSLAKRETLSPRPRSPRSSEK